jgi:hypothetical protein
MRHLKAGLVGLLIGGAVATGALADGIQGARRRRSTKAACKIALVSYLSQGDYFEAYEAGVAASSEGAWRRLAHIPGQTGCRPPARADRAGDFSLGVQGIIVSHGQPEAVKDVIQKALDAGIKVVVKDIDIGNPKVPLDLAERSRDRAAGSRRGAEGTTETSFDGGLCLRRWASVRSSCAAKSGPMSRRPIRESSQKAVWGAVDSNTATTVASQTAAVLRAHRRARHDRRQRPADRPRTRNTARNGKRASISRSRRSTAKGGVKGRPLQYVFEDSQADPRQSVAIAQKFVSDPKIVVEVGDFSSTASMAASPIYQRAGLVQFGFTNSHPNFTKGGDFMWSNSVSQADEQPRLAKYAADLGLKRSPCSISTPTGAAQPEIFVRGRQGQRRRVVASKAISPTRRISARRWCACATPSPTAIILISYYADGALIARQSAPSA